MLINKHIITSLLLLLIVYAVQGQSHWESIILASDSMNYLEALSEPPTDWNTPGFNDDSWKRGPGGFGYSDGDDNTVIATVNSVYIRKKFSVSDKSIIENILLDIDYDDGFVAYMNGNEIARSGNVTAANPTYNSTLTTDHEARLYQGGQPERFLLNTSILNEGENLLAVQVINVGITSSDLSALIFLNVKINSIDQVYKTIPDWFTEPVDFSTSNLPLIFINTSGADIPYDNKITAHMGITDNVNGSNSIGDPFTNYDGYIGIDGRGSSSRWFDKKNYNIETRTESGENNNMSLLGMPEENDWVLHGPYSDKSLMRNVLTFYFGRATGRWAPRTRFCELFINSEYNGVYVLMEKIKRDKNRINISELFSNANTGDLLTGGYILSIDRPDDEYWNSSFVSINGNEQVTFNYIYPDPEDMSFHQKEYIKNYIKEFEYELFQFPNKDYKPYVNLESFIDFYIVNELCRNIDAYRLSTFLYKDRDSRGGKLTMGPLWDFNLSLGNANYFEGNNPQGWILSASGYPSPFWWKRLREDPYFNYELKKRWFELRDGPFSESSIYSVIDSISSLIDEAQERNFSKYQILGQYIWPNHYVAQTYDDEIIFMKNWIHERLDWIDNQLKVIPEYTTVTEVIANSYEIYSFPNPFIDRFIIRIPLFKNATVNIAIYNVMGEKVYEYNQVFNAGVQDIDIYVSDISTGMYFYEVKLNNKLVRTDKIIKE